MTEMVTCVWFDFAAMSKQSPLPRTGRDSRATVKGLPAKEPPEFLICDSTATKSPQLRVRAKPLRRISTNHFGDQNAPPGHCPGCN